MVATAMLAWTHAAIKAHRLCAGTCTGSIPFRAGSGVAGRGPYVQAPALACIQFGVPSIHDGLVVTMEEYQELR